MDGQGESNEKMLPKKKEEEEQEAPFFFFLNRPRLSRSLFFFSLRSSSLSLFSSLPANKSTQSRHQVNKRRRREKEEEGEEEGETDWGGERRKEGKTTAEGEEGKGGPNGAPGFPSFFLLPCDEVIIPPLFLPLSSAVMHLGESEATSASSHSPNLSP